MVYIKRFYGFNLSKAKDLKGKLHNAVCRRNNIINKGLDAGFLEEKIVVYKSELNSLIVKGQKFDLGGGNNGIEC